MDANEQKNCIATGIDLNTLTYTGSSITGITANSFATAGGSVWSSSYSNENVLDKAASVFHNLKMNKTELRNGVLFYLAVNDKKFAILGDKGINEKVPGNFWDNIKNSMLEHFKNEQFTEGLAKGIEMAGEKLKVHFPLQINDKNELNNDISFGK